MIQHPNQVPAIETDACASVTGVRPADLRRWQYVDAGGREGWRV